MLVSPSILSADWTRLDEAVRLAEQGADWLHVDVMDGHFVPNLTFGVKVIETVRKLTALPLDVHLMVLSPEKYFDSFAKAGATTMTIHVETAPHLHRQLMKIKDLGCRAGAVVNPATPVDTLADVVQDLDLLLIMSVNPGFSAQSFIPASLGKIARAREMLDAARSAADLEVDGGVGRDTIRDVWRAGADTFVAGNAIFGASDPRAEIAALRALCRETA